jgi:hypothetical protein
MMVVAIVSILGAFTTILNSGLKARARVPFVLLIEYVIFFPDPFPKLGVEVLVAVASYIAALFLFRTLEKRPKHNKTNTTNKTV